MDNLFLQGPFAPQRNEGRGEATVIEGQIPADLNGTLYRAGASPYFDPLFPELHHWFDGDGYITALTLSEGQATVRSSYVATAGLQAEKAAGKALYGSFMNGGVAPIMDGSRPPFKNPANTNVVRHDGELLVFCEADVPHRLDPDTLETRGMYDFGGIQGPVTAHFKIDPASGEWLFFGSMGKAVQFYRADRSGQVIARHPFQLDAPCFLHDFAVSENYAIFFATPALSDFNFVLQGKPASVWDPEVQTRIGLMERSTGELRWYPVDQAFATTHFLNAFEQDGKVIVDVNCAPDFGARANERVPFSVAKPWRWTIDPATGKVSGTQMADFNSEFPRINDLWTGRQHRYGYYAGTDTDTFCKDCLFDKLVKHDTVTGNHLYQSVSPELNSPGEPVFVPREGATAEDDGYVLSIWWDAARDASELVILDAQDFAGKPLARVRLGMRVPMGFHGNWSAH